MQKIKHKATKAEVKLAKTLWSKGLRYRKNYKYLPGKPDIAITKYKIAIFIDGEFWHGHNWDEKQKRIISNRDYWIPKIEKNINRDKINNEKLLLMGWKVYRFWEKDINKDFDKCVNLILEYCQSLTKE